MTERNSNKQNTASSATSQPREADTRPWDYRPAKGLDLVILSACFILTVFVGIGAGIAVLALAAEPYHPMEGLAFFVSLAVMVLAVTISMRLYPRINLSDLEKRCKDSHVWLMPASYCRTLRGQGKVEFALGSLSINGKLGPNMILGLPIIILGSIVVPLVEGRGLSTPVEAGFRTVVLGGVYVWLLSQHRTIEIHREDVEALRCQEAVVTLILRRAPFTGLRRICFFVPRQYALDFFSKFEIALPALLPSDYREALCRVDHEQGAQTSTLERSVSAELLTLKLTDFCEKMLQTSTPVLAFFFSSDCQVVGDVNAILEEVAQVFQDRISVFLVDCTERSPEAVSRFRLNSLPRLLLLAPHTGYNLASLPSDASKAQVVVAVSEALPDLAHFLVTMIHPTK